MVLQVSWNVSHLSKPMQDSIFAEGVEDETLFSELPDRIVPTKFLDLHGPTSLCSWLTYLKNTWK